MPISESRRERLSIRMTVSKNGEFNYIYHLLVTNFAITPLTIFVTSRP
jgi:hypothetical protein